MDLSEAARVADRDGWISHAQGRAEARDLHWRYRDILARLADDDTTSRDGEDGHDRHHH